MSKLWTSFLGPRHMRRSPPPPPPPFIHPHPTPLPYPSHSTKCRQCACPNRNYTDHARARADKAEKNNRSKQRQRISSQTAEDCAARNGAMFFHRCHDENECYKHAARVLKTCGGFLVSKHKNYVLSSHNYNNVYIITNVFSP